MRGGGCALWHAVRHRRLVNKYQDDSSLDTCHTILHTQTHTPTRTHLPTPTHRRTPKDDILIRYIQVVTGTLYAGDLRVNIVWYSSCMILGENNIKINSLILCMVKRNTVWNFYEDKLFRTSAWYYQNYFGFLNWVRNLLYSSNFCMELQNCCWNFCMM